MLNIIEGDLFALQDVDAIGHGINCKGLMGAGIAVGFKNKYKLMHTEYVKACKNNSIQPGDVFAYKILDPINQVQWVMNCASQNNPGADAQYDWLEESVTNAVHYLQEQNLQSLALPMIGAGIGGLQEDKVIKILEKISNDNDFLITLVKYKP